MRKKLTIAIIIASMAMSALVGCAKKTDEKPSEIVTTAPISETVETTANDIEETTKSENIYDNAFDKYKLHTCNNVNYEEFQITNIIGNIKDFKTAGDKLIFATDNGLWIYGVSGEDRDEMKKAHGLIKLSEQTDLEIVGAGFSTAICKNSKDEYFAYYTNGSAKKSFYDADYTLDNVGEEVKVNWPDDIKEIVYVSYSFDNAMFFYYINTKGEIAEFGVKGNGTNRTDEYGVLQTEMYETGDKSFWPGYGLRTYLDPSSESSGKATRVNYNIKKMVGIRQDGFGLGDFYFLADDNKIYGMLSGSGDIFISEMYVRNYEIDDKGYAFHDNGYTTKLCNIANVDTLFDSSYNADQFEFTKIDDKDTLYVAKRKLKPDFVYEFDLNAIGHKTDDITNIYSSGGIVWVEFSNKEIYRLKSKTTDETYTVSKDEDLTKINEAGVIKFITTDDKGYVVVVDNNNLVYQFD